MEPSPLYFGVKLIAYSSWMWLGYAWLKPESSRRALRALGLGAARLLMGLGFGIVIWLLGSWVYAGAAEALDRSSRLIPQLVTYLLVYVPIRWIEWGCFELPLTSWSWSTLVKPTSATAGKWRVGGIVVSCLADIPVLIAFGGLPLGRFMC